MVPCRRWTRLCSSTTPALHPEASPSCSWRPLTPLCRTPRFSTLSFPVLNKKPPLSQKVLLLSSHSSNTSRLFDSELTPFLHTQTHTHVHANIPPHTHATTTCKGPHPCPPAPAASPGYEGAQEGLISRNTKLSTACYVHPTCLENQLRPGQHQ